MIAACAAALVFSSWAGASMIDDAFILKSRAGPGADAVKSISQLSKEELLELRKLYARYADLVQKRRDDDWSYGLESGELIEHPQEARLPVRQLEEAYAKREVELEKLAAQRAKAESENAAARLDFALDAKKGELKKLKRALSKAKGTCADWSDLVWADLLKVKAEGWDLRDGPRRARPWHTAAVACAPAGAQTPAVCLAFDPWKTGTPEVYDFDSWDAGSFEGVIAPEFFLHHLPEPEGS